MTRSIIDPVTRIEGHLRIEMEVEQGKVANAWVSGGCFRGMELVLQQKTPRDAAEIVQRVCGVCPVSHAHASSFAAEKALGITIPNNARIIRNIVEGAQFLHSNLLWFYNLAGLDYINPLNALKANVADAYDLAMQAGTSSNSDLAALKARLANFAENKQLSIFSGNWFDADGGKAYKLSPEADLLGTAHYLECLQMQAKASEIAALVGGKMPHIMTAVPGGSAFVPTEEKLDDLYALAHELHEWIKTTVVQDTILIASHYKEAFEWGKGCGRYVAWGVFNRPSMEMQDRYLPSGVLKEGFELHEVEESLISEYVGSSWYKGTETYQSPYFETNPEYTDYSTDDRYTWVKAPSYDGQCMEATSLSRLLVAYKRGVPFVVEHVDALLQSLGAKGKLQVLQSTMGRTGARQIETLYVSYLMLDWIGELMEAIKGGDSKYFEPEHGQDGAGTGFWEAPRGALYHSEKVVGGHIAGYQIIIPSTWNLAPRNQQGELGPLEQSLIGIPVEDVEKPINALRTVHSYDPCTACAVHVTEPASGKHFEMISSPWGVR